ncbi:MAG: hypothetical protein BWY93_01062 [Euryarchaeota archaeon ADurb.BinA087]|nr:MAG: hypothetical protein BWY93_01062 [Euryarchaeota archaeon ADurb.BinA087]
MKSAICRIELPGGEQIERGTTESGFGHQFYGYASPISSKKRDGISLLFHTQAKRPLGLSLCF